MTSAPVSESAREREVFSYLRSSPAKPQDLYDFLNQHANAGLPTNFAPVPSQDPALTAFAQLGALRLNVSRAMISLIDGHIESVLAEATRDLSLRAHSRYATTDGLWLGSVTIPRRRGIDERVLDLPHCAQDDTESCSEDVVVIEDLADVPDFPLRNLLGRTFDARFFAAVPIRSPTGAVLGSYAVFHDQLRHGISKQELIFLQDTAATVMDHLVLSKAQEQHKRGEQMIRGLTSFMTGSDFLDDGSGSEQRLIPVPNKIWQWKTPNGGDSEARPESSEGEQPISLAKRPKSPSNEPSPDTIPPPDEQSWSDDHEKAQSPTLQESMLPQNAKKMFSRAANILRQTSELDGTLIFDAALSSFQGSTRHAGNDEGDGHTGRKSSLISGSSDTSETNDKPSVDHSADETYAHERPSDQRNGDKSRIKHCEILGFSNVDRSSISGNIANKRYLSFAESHLSKLLKKYPAGKVFNINDDGALSSDDCESKSGSAAEDISGKARPKPGRKTEIETILEIAPDARSIILLPLWDFSRKRWFAACFMWSSDKKRILSGTDLQYMRAFGNSVMVELSRLDAITSDVTKTTFMSSISHELRSPLHGILGGIQFLQETTVDAFQVGMINSIETCGKTLLDTVDHILDFAKINKLARFRPRDSKRRTVGGHARTLSFESANNNLRSSDLHIRSVDLSLLVEEVIEATMAGQSYKLVPQVYMASGAHKRSQDWLYSGGQNPEMDADEGRKQVYIALDVSRRQNWDFVTRGGAWRRIMMNIFGNAYKFTDKGFIRLSLDGEDVSTDNDETRTRVTLRISDSGIGISQEFLYNKLYAPFSQEDAFSTGTGVGLSIVRQVVRSLGGKIYFKSQQGIGTEVKVTIELPAAPQYHDSPSSDGSSSVSDMGLQLGGRSIGLLEPYVDPGTSGTDSNSPEGKGLRNTTDSLMKYLKDWFGARPFLLYAHDSESAQQAEIIICTEPSFLFLAAIRSERPQGKVPLVIFIAHDALEASTLRGDPRVNSSESIVEIITQPCGPHKLAKCFQQCLRRFDKWLYEVRPPSVEATRNNSEDSTFLLKPAFQDLAVDQLAEDFSSAVLKEDNTPTRTPPQVPVEVPVEKPKQKPTPPAKVSRHRSNSLPHSARRPHVSPQKTSSPPAAPLKRSGTSDLEETRTSPKILIVDDNRINLRLLSAFMKKHLLSYEQATNGLEALEAYKRASGGFKIVLMDISMPVMDGMEATREIRDYEDENNIDRSLIIALTGLVSASARVEALASGIDHFMTKPVNFQLLIELMDSNSDKVADADAEKNISRST
ncbi:uncharacterized protein K452DRAFT_358747 [Aplosporella prunicola CBS 121167]|uniref:Histidine kinase n=1 Tax=Aplosporella prunicola CBS 121167 TaxID=1176127 RepID=A0A6A6BBL0_9PEZI|nr:uncharacterized protein K452DRAFT_358747 [Aplosporella prunicola CBS 121167]KAF2141622.1 hypothetical protein K452DRAFT_358747 [Aplosporella prunicola CBS 121167]